MKAIVVSKFGGPDVLQLADRPDPVPAPDQVVVRVRAAGVNPVDTYIRAGSYARLPDLPYIPGTDGAGDIETVGNAVGGWKPGDRVWMFVRQSGTYAEKVACSADHVFRLPSNTSYEAGAALGVPAATAYRALFGRARARAQETVLVHGGSGSVGLSVVQLAKAAGLRVLATAGSDDGLELLRKEGADAVFNHHDPARADAIRNTTNGRGVDIVIEMLANQNLDLDLSLLAQGGRVVVVGNRGRIEIDPRQTMAKDSAILGMTLWNVPSDELRRINESLTEALEKGTLRPAIDRTYPLGDAPAAHDAVLKSGRAGKIVLIP